MHRAMRLVLLAVLLALNVKFTLINAQGDNLTYTLAVAWSHDGTQVAAVGVQPEAPSGYIRVTNVQTLETIYQQDPQPGGFTSVSWSPNDRFIAAGSYDGTVWIFDLETGTHTATLWGHQAPVDDVDWNSDGTRLVSGGNSDQLVILWDMSTYQPIRRLETQNFIYSVAFSPDDQKIAVGGESGLFLFPSNLEVGDGRDQLTYQYVRGYSSILAWRPDGRQIAFGTQTFRLSNGERPNAHLFLIDTDTSAIIRDIESSSGTIAGLAWSPDNTLLAVYHQDDLVTVLDSETGSVLETFTGNGPSRYSIGNLDFSPYGGRLAYGITIPSDLAVSTTAQTEGIDAVQALANSGVQIVVPAPSLERLQSIADACNAPTAVEQAITSVQTDQISNFVTAVETLPEDTIPPACAADLIAVAQALQSR